MHDHTSFAPEGMRPRMRPPGPPHFHGPRFGPRMMGPRGPRPPRFQPPESEWGEDFAEDQEGFIAFGPRPVRPRGPRPVRPPFPGHPHPGIRGPHLVPEEFEPEAPISPLMQQSVKALLDNGPQPMHAGPRGPRPRMMGAPSAPRPPSERGRRPKKPPRQPKMAVQPHNGAAPAGPAANKGAVEESKKETETVNGNQAPKTEKPPESTQENVQDSTPVLTQENTEKEQDGPMSEEDLAKCLPMQFAGRVMPLGKKNAQDSTPKPTEENKEKEPDGPMSEEDLAKFLPMRFASRVMPLGKFDQLFDPAKLARGKRRKKKKLKIYNEAGELVEPEPPAPPPFMHPTREFDPSAHHPGLHVIPDEFDPHPQEWGAHPPGPHAMPPVGYDPHSGENWGQPSEEWGPYAPGPNGEAPFPSRSPFWGPRGFPPGKRGPAPFPGMRPGGPFPPRGPNGEPLQGFQPRGPPPHFMGRPRGPRPDFGQGWEDPNVGSMWEMYSHAVDQYQQGNASQAMPWQQGGMDMTMFKQWTDWYQQMMMWVQQWGPELAKQQKSSQEKMMMQQFQSMLQHYGSSIAPEKSTAEKPATSTPSDHHIQQMPVAYEKAETSAQSLDDKKKNLAKAAVVYAKFQGANVEYKEPTLPEHMVKEPAKEPEQKPKSRKQKISIQNTISKKDNKADDTQKELQKALEKKRQELKAKEEKAQPKHLQLLEQEKNRLKIMKERIGTQKKDQGKSKRENIFIPMERGAYEPPKNPVRPKSILKKSKPEPLPEELPETTTKDMTSSLTLASLTAEARAKKAETKLTSSLSESPSVSTSAAPSKSRSDAPKSESSSVQSGLYDPFEALDKEEARITEELRKYQERLSKVNEIAKASSQSSTNTHYDPPTHDSRHYDPPTSDSRHYDPPTRDNRHYDPPARESFQHFSRTESYSHPQPQSYSYSQSSHYDSRPSESHYASKRTYDDRYQNPQPPMSYQPQVNDYGHSNEPPAKQPRQDPGAEQQKSSIFIGNLTNGTRAIDVRELVTAYGRVINCKVGINKSNGTLFSLVTLDSASDAQQCVLQLNQTNFRGNFIEVKKVKT